MNVFGSYSFDSTSNINKFVENTLEELKDDAQDLQRDRFRQNDKIYIDSHEYYQNQKCFDISKIKKEPSFHFDELASSTPTRMPFSFSSGENNHEEKQYGSVANSLNKDMDVEENHPPIWKYEMESTLDSKKATLLDIQNSTTIQEGNTHRLLNLFEASYSEFKETKKSSNNQENVGSNEVSLNNPEEAKQKKLSIKKKIEDEAFQLGRQKGIREILSSMVSPITANNSSSLGNPDLSLTYLQKENVMLLNKLAGNSGSLTRPNFEDTSNIYAANISKEESRVKYFDCNEKLKRADEKIELEGLIKIWLKPFWNTDIIDKNDYKNIMLKCVRKISYWKEEERSPVSIRRLVEFYIKKLRHENKTGKHPYLRNTFGTEKSGSKSTPQSKMSETQITLNGVSNKKCNAHMYDSSGKSPNINITIKQSCCNNSKQSCKKKGKINSRKNVVSGEKGKNVKRWRY